MPLIAVTVKSATVELFTVKPAEATGPNWKVQYFNLKVPLTSASTTIRRVVELPPARYKLIAKWTKTGQTPIVSDVTLFWDGFASPGPADPPPPPTPPPNPVNCVVSAWGPWSAWVLINGGTAERRTRTRTIITQPSSGGTACPVLSDSETRPVVTPPPGGPARLIVPSDLQYLGMMRCPATGPRMDFSYGQLTGRRVDGHVHLLMTGNTVMGDPLYEFMDTENYAAVPASAPRMELVREWGYIYGDKRTTWTADGTPENMPGRRMGGLHWNEANQLIYWTYLETYNVSHRLDWSLGASALNSNGTSTAYGPWRPQGGPTEEGKYGPWICTRVTEHPDTGAMLCGATISSGNVGSPWGPELWQGTFPTQSTPAGYGNPDIEVEKYLTYYFAASSINQTTGALTGPLISCRRPGDYFFEPFANTLKLNVNPLLNSGVGSWSELDVWGDVTWINLTDRYGVIYTGRFAAGHEWYANGANAYTCTHGVAAPVQITGPVATEGYPVIWIFDPADLVEVFDGDKTDYTVDPTSTINAKTAYGLVTADISAVGAGEYIGGQYFDTVTRRLYVCAPEADRTIPGYVLPLVHVFQVN